MMASALLEPQTVSALPGNDGTEGARAQRLLRHADFERVYKQGRRHFSATMTVFFCQRSAIADDVSRPGSAVHGVRVGFTVSKALGGAVERNRMKRRLREAVRLTAAPMADVDIVINPKKSLLAAEFSRICGEIERAFALIAKQAGSALKRSREAGEIAGGLS